MAGSPLSRISSGDQGSADTTSSTSASTTKLSATPGAGGVSFVAAMALSNVGNFLFHMVASRRLGPASYGALASTLGIMLALALPTASIQVSVTGSAAKLFARGGSYTIRPFARKGLAISASLSLLIAGFAPLVAGSLNLDSTAAVLWLALFAPAAFMSTIGRGVLMAESRFAALSLIVLATTTTRVGAAFFLLKPGDTEGKAMMLTVVVEYLLAAALTAAIAPRLANHARRVRVAAGALSASSVAFAGLWVLLAADLVLARRLLTPEQAGIYAAAAMGARAALFLPQAIAQIAHAKLAGATPEAGRVISRVALVATVGFAAINIIGMALLGPWLVVVGFGSEYTPNRLLIVVLTAAASLLALGSLGIHLRLAVGRSSSQVWLGIVVLVALGFTVPDSPLALALASVGAAGALVATLSSPLQIRAARHPAGPPPSRRAPQLDVSVVVPYRSDHHDLAESFRSIARLARHAEWNFEVIAVSRDGSANRQAQIHGLTGGRLNHLSCVPERRGCVDAQTALRLGARSARGRNVVFFDPDTGIDPATIVSFVELRDFYGCDAIVGSKRHPESQTNYPAPRRLVSWCYQMLVQSLFQVKVRDCQVSCKVFSLETIRDVIPLTSAEGLAFELELVVFASRTRHRRLVEAPISTNHRFTSLIDVGSGTGMVMATLKLRATLNRRLHSSLHAPATGSRATA